MSKNKLIILLSAVFLIIAVVFIVFENESIFPSALVAFFLVLTFLGDNSKNANNTGKASQWAIVIFSIIVIALNIITPVILPVITSGWDFSNFDMELTTSLGTKNPQIIKDHFIQVTINDMRELCYSTCILLATNLILLLAFRNRKKNS